MSRRSKALRAFLYQNPNATVEEAWHAAWDNEQARVSSLKHQEKDTRIAELEQQVEAMGTDLGLMEISRDQKNVLLASCETALASRDETIAELQQANEALQWIPVSERLPEPGQEVLAWEESIVHVTFWTGTEWDAWAEITHWMPLPAPPEQLEGE